MSKFRARQLDATKPIPIYFQEDILDSTEFNNVTNRTVPQLPTGMEKEEETEHHLQQAIFHHRVIPVPEVYNTEDENSITYDQLYPPSYKGTRQMIHIHPFSAEQDIPDYDLDSEDEDWLHNHARKGELLPLDALQFEEMMDRLEKASGLKAVTLQEAKLLLKDDDDLITAVYDYWLNKRLRLQHALIPQVRKFMVKTEKGVGSTPTDPYVAFRKRTEKMQTRKNRKNDETSYEKMLKLRRDLLRAVTLVELMKRREKVKREQLHLNIELYEKRYELEDFSGTIINDITSQRLNQQPTRPAFAPIIPNHQIGISDVATDSSGIGSSGSLWLKVPAMSRTSKEESKRERRPYKKKRKHLQISSTASSTPPNTPQLPRYTHPPDPYSIASVFSQSSAFSLGSEDEMQSHSEAEDDISLDGYYAFRRKPQVNYLAPRDNFMDSSNDCNPIFGTCSGNSKQKYQQYYLTSLSHPAEKFVGMARRRVGRGGRVWLDRIHHPSEDFRVKVEPADCSSDSLKTPSDIKADWPHFHPSVVARAESSEESEDVDVDVETVSGVPSSPCLGTEATPSLREESVTGGRGIDGTTPPACYMTAEILEGVQKGLFTSLRVTLPPLEDIDVFSVMEEDSDAVAPHTQSETLTSGCSGGSNSMCSATTSTTTQHHNSIESDVLDSEWCCGGGKTGISTNNSSRWTLVNNNSVCKSVCSDSVAENVAMCSNQQKHSSSCIDFQTQPSSKFCVISDASSCQCPVSNHSRHHNTSSTSSHTSTSHPTSSHTCTSHSDVGDESLKLGVSSLSSRSNNNNNSFIQPISSSLPLSSSSSLSSSTTPIVSSSPVHSRHLKNSLDITSLLQSTSMLSKTSLSNSLLGASQVSTNITSTSLTTKTSEDTGSKLQAEQNSKKLPHASSLYFRPSSKDRLNIDSLPSGLILSSSTKNNGTNVLNNSNSSLVSQKFLSWTNDSLANDEKTVITNGPSSKTLDNLKCTKVTPLLYPET